MLLLAAAFAMSSCGRVTFLGVNAMDNRQDAGEFLGENPTGLPHFYDPDAKIARVFCGGRYWPTTAFYDAKGEQSETFGNGLSVIDAPNLMLAFAAGLVSFLSPCCLPLVPGEHRLAGRGC